MSWNHRSSSPKGLLPEKKSTQKTVFRRLSYELLCDSLRNPGTELCSHTLWHLRMNIVYLCPCDADATFDHVLPLALKQMPTVLGSLIHDTVTNYANLNNGEMLARLEPFLMINALIKRYVVSTSAALQAPGKDVLG